jgi:hypothetical protein
MTSWQKAQRTLIEEKYWARSFFGTAEDKQRNHIKMKKELAEFDRSLETGGA